MDTEKIVDVIIEDTKNVLETLLDLNRATVYCLINEVDKKIQIYYSSNTLKHLSRLLDEIMVSGQWIALKNDIKKCKLVIIETTDNKLRLGYWIDYYRNQGYSFYKDISPILYSFNIKIEYFPKKLVYVLSLKNSTNEIVIGKFNKKKEMEEFKRLHYPDKVITKIVYHKSVSNI